VVNNLKRELVSYSGWIVNLAAILSVCLKRIFYWLSEDYSERGYLDLDLFKRLNLAEENDRHSREAMSVKSDAISTSSMLHILQQFPK